MSTLSNLNERGGMPYLHPVLEKWDDESQNRKRIGRRSEGGSIKMAQGHAAGLLGGGRPTRQFKRADTRRHLQNREKLLHATYWHVRLRLLFEGLGSL